LTPGVVINGNLLVDGSVAAQKIDTRGLTVRDANGNVILGSGTNLDWSFIRNQPAGIYNSNITLNANGTLSGAGGGQVTLNGLGAGALATKNDVRIGSEVKFPDGSTMQVGDFVSRLSKIGSNNISTFMESAAIGSAYIGNAAIGAAHIQDLAVNTFKIADQAVTIPVSAQSGSPGYSVSVSIYSDVSATVTVLASFAQGDNKNLHDWYLYVNGQLIRGERPKEGTVNTIIQLVTVSPGYTSFTLSCANTTGDGRCGIVVLGHKK
jgi:hypothetical protein